MSATAPHQAKASLQPSLDCLPTTDLVQHPLGQHQALRILCKEGWEARE